MRQKKIMLIKHFWFSRYVEANKMVPLKQCVDFKKSEADENYILQSSVNFKENN